MDKSWTNAFAIQSSGCTDARFMKGRVDTGKKIEVVGPCWLDYRQCIVGLVGKKARFKSCDIAVWFGRLLPCQRGNACLFG
jgi:hypothetical protein